MKKILVILFLLPFCGNAQKMWYGTGGVLYIDRTLNHTGYGAEFNANTRLIKDFYLGLGTGISKIPILSKAYIPVVGKATFFTTLNNSNLLPFATVEVGYGVYSDNAGRKGNVTAFGGVGFSFDTDVMPPPYLSFGYGVYGYTLSTGEPATQRRATLKLGILLNRRKQY